MKALEENSKVSSMRIAFVAVIVMASALVMSLCTYIGASIFMAATIEWGGVSVFLGAIGVFLTPAFTGKAIQKRFEK